jgi:epoxide hydrolase-like predicted phosphatase
MNPKINTFIFDCFKVVCAAPFSGWNKDHMTDQGLIDEKFDEILMDYDLGKLSEEDVTEHFSKCAGIASSKEEIQEQIDSYLKIDEDLVNLIKQLRNKGYKTALLSNGNHAFFERKVYQTYPYFKNLFDEIVISSEIGITKPDKGIYLHTLEKINSKPEDSLFIDDRQINIDGAVKVGINGYLYTSNNTFAEYIKSIGIDLNN